VAKQPDTGTGPANDVEDEVGKRQRGRPRQGPAVARHLPRDEEILKIAAQVFFAQGYEGAKLEDIAREAGIVKGSLYHYFESKEHLYERLLEQIVELVDVEVAAGSDRPPAERLAELVRSEVRLVANNPVEIGIIGRHLVHMEGEIGEWARGFRQNFVERVREIIEQGQLEGAFRRGDAATMSAFILGSITVLAEWYRPEGRLGVEEIADEMTAFVLDGVGVEAQRAENGVRSSVAGRTS